MQGVNQTISEAYDKQVYTSNAFPFSSPNHLRAAALLWGLESVPLTNARVLELGCAGGGNLLPFATAYKNAQVVGVDLSRVQIEQGQAMVKTLGLKNIHLHVMSLTEISQEFGEFDYIIAHGVFSWVPPEVRAEIMRILRENLSDRGIGYISYNTYPGWKAGDIVRDAMLLHSSVVGEQSDKVAAARAMLSLLSDGIAASNPLGPSLHAAVDQLRQHSDYYIAHEYLEIFNNPCYLLEFADMADQHGLMHVGDVEPQTELSAVYGQNVQINHSLIALGQARILRQQYLDFSVGRTFRKSLVVRKERAGEILNSPSIDRLKELRWAGHFTETTRSPDAPPHFRAFHNHKNHFLQTADTRVISVIQALTSAWPASLDFDSLVTDSLANLDVAEISEGAKNVFRALETLFRQNLIRYSLEPSPYDRGLVQKASAPNLIPGFAHIYRERENPEFSIGTYNMWHDSVNIKLHEAEAYILPYIDGARSRKQLITILRDALHNGRVPSTDGKPLKGQRNLDKLAETIFDKLTELLRRHAILV
jgi:Cyclopropane fatty acid synthase and related methyltransferases